MATLQKKIEADYDDLVDAFIATQDGAAVPAGRGPILYAAMVQASLALSLNALVIG